MKYGLTAKDMQMTRKSLRDKRVTFNHAMKSLGILYRANKRLAVINH